MVIVDLLRNSETLSKLRVSLSIPLSLRELLKVIVNSQVNRLSKSELVESLRQTNGFILRVVQLVLLTMVQHHLYFFNSGAFGHHP